MEEETSEAKDRREWQNIYLDNKQARVAFLVVSVSIARYIHCDFYNTWHLWYIRQSTISNFYTCVSHAFLYLFEHHVYNLYLRIVRCV